VAPESAQRIVVATDFSDGAARALTVAMKFAKPLGAAIDLVHVYPIAAAGVGSPLPGAVAMPPPTPQLLDGIQRELDDAAGVARRAGIDCSTTIAEGNAAEKIVAHADRVGADLIVAGTHGRTGLRRVLLGSVAEQILRKAHGPVLVVPPGRD
jgi:nucleotide-binding universal stress UspA family protein